MTLTSTSGTVASLQGTAWSLVRYTDSGVTASLSSDMRTGLAFVDEGGFEVTSGLLCGSGTAVVGPETVTFAREALTGSEATLPGSLEDRVVHAVDGAFEMQRSEAGLRLRQDGTTLEFVSVTG